MNAKFSQQANHIHAQTTPANGKGPKVQSAKYSCSPLTPETAEEPIKSRKGPTVGGRRCKVDTLVSAISSHISPLQAVSAVLRPSHPLTEVWE